MFVQAAKSIGFAAVLALASYAVFGRETAIRNFAIVLTVSLVLTGLSSLQRKEAATERDGWRALRPSTMHWVSLVLSGGITGLLLYIYFFVGSARADAATQMKILGGLVVAFGACTVISFATCFVAKVRWNGERIESWLGPRLRRAIAWRDLAGAEFREPSGPIVLYAQTGEKLSIDPNCNGAEELCEELRRWLPTSPAAAACP